MQQRQIFIGILLTLLIMVIGVTPAHAQAAQSSEVILLVNALRASKGLPAYRVDATLTAVAQAQAEWSAANNHFGHDGPGGNTPRDRAILGGYGGGKSISAQENVANGTLPYITPDWVVTMWQGDDIHLGALLSTRHDDIGVGYAEANDYAWYVMMIGRVGSGSLAPTRPPSEPKPPVGTDVPAAPAEAVIPVQLNTPEQDGSLHHIVQAGQTAWTVAAYYEIDLQELLTLNNLTENSVLRPGDVLLIRPPAPQTLTPLIPTLAQIAAVPSAIQIPSDAPTPSRYLAEKPRTKSTTPIWVSLALAVIVLASSVGRAIIILRRQQVERGSSPDE